MTVKKMAMMRVIKEEIFSEDGLGAWRRKRLEKESV